MAMKTNMSRIEVQTNSNTKNLKLLIANLTEGENDIKDYHFMIEWFDRIVADSSEAEDDSDPELKWTKISDMFRGFGYPLKNFSANKCRDRFYQWSAFYAKNYDSLNGNLEPKYQKIFDLLKIIHILDFKTIWCDSNHTHTLLRVIDKNREIKDYLLDYYKRQEKLEKEKATRVGHFNGTVVTNNNVSPNDPIYRFEDMNLKPTLLKGILGFNYKVPSFVQQRAIVPAIIGKDVIAQAQSGTGKTAAFAIAILQVIDISLNECQALILVPTHELAQQIYRDITQLSKYMDIECHTSVGGIDTDEDIDGLGKKKPHIIIATPFRVIDLMEREAFKTEYIKMFVLDECDKLLDLNDNYSSSTPLGKFKNQIFIIYRKLDPNIQVFLSSATIPNKILNRTEIIMRSPVRILIRNEELTLRGLQQYYVKVEEGHKFATFVDLYNRMNESNSFKSSKAQVFIYRNRRDSVQRLANELRRADISVDYTHGKVKEEERLDIFNDFREGNIRFLITTDMLGRGIDIKDVEYIFNYDLPDIPETYMHRVGRSGRFGRTGIAINFVRDIQTDALRQIETFYNTQVNPLPHDLSTIF